MENRVGLVTNVGMRLRNPSSFFFRQEQGAFTLGVEKVAMQAGQPPEDLHAILGRFHTWAGKQPANGNDRGKGAPEEGIRKISHEEAIRRHRSRNGVPAQRGGATQPIQDAGISEGIEKPASSTPAKITEPQEKLPSWLENLPVIPETEPYVDVKATPQTSTALGQKAISTSPVVGAGVAMPARRNARRSPASRTTAAKSPAAPDASFFSTLPDALPARAYVDLPKAPLSARSRPQRRTSAPLPAPPKPPAAAVQVTPASRPASAAIPSKPAARPKPPVPPVRMSPPSVTAEPQVNPLGPSAMIGSPMKTLPASPMRRPVVKKAGPARAAKPGSRTRKRAPFRQVLASTVQQPKELLAPKNKREPDRTRRITTRFSPAEERRIEKSAAELGITVSAYLRRCALAAVLQKPLPEGPEPVIAAKTRKTKAHGTEGPIRYAAPAPSFLGGWLALLRNRFLGPPVRFSEDA